jgi:2-polyprenyl-6-methoxyphenol hydroxylase-like FAD-dependent oxidoreductase
VACRIRFSFDLEAAERLSHITGQIDRRTLRQALFSGLQDCVQVAKSFTPYEEVPSGVIAHFDDGSSTAGDILVGADGTHAKVREQRIPESALLLTYDHISSSRGKGYESVMQ